MGKFFLYKIILAVMLAVVLLTGCNKENAENSITGSETEAVPESEGNFSEIQTAQHEAVIETKSYEPYKINLYNSLGTGIPRPENYGEDMTEYRLSGTLDNILSMLKNKDVAEKIDSEAEKLLDIAKENYHLYEYGELTQGKYSSYCYGYNGYLFYSIYYDLFPMAYCAVFDLRTGEHLELSDLFFEGEEFLPLLNQKIREKVQEITVSDYNYNDIRYIPMKREFAGLTEGGFYFNDDRFYFPVDNPYFTECVTVDVSILLFDTVLNVPYDMTELFEENAEDKISMFIRDNSIISSDWNAYSRFYKTGNISFSLFAGSSFLTAKQEQFLAEQTENIILTKLDELNEKYDWIAYTYGDEPMHKSYESDGEMIAYDENYSISSGIFRNNFVYICFAKDSQVYEKTYNLYFDFDTLEPLGIEEIFKRVYRDKNLKWDHMILDLKGDRDYDYKKMDNFFGENPPEIKNIRPEDITLKYSSGSLSYYEETEDYIVWWRAKPVQEE